MMHIRQVLTKAELDNLSLSKDLLTDVRSEPLCFLCKTTRFNLFKKKFTCKFCAKSVCKSCCRFIQMPNTNLLRVPITILSPATSRVMAGGEGPKGNSCLDSSRCKSRDSLAPCGSCDLCLDSSSGNLKHSKRATAVSSTTASSNKSGSIRRSSLVGTHSTDGRTSPTSQLTNTRLCRKEEVCSSDDEEE